MHLLAACLIAHYMVLCSVSTSDLFSRVTSSRNNQGTTTPLDSWTLHQRCWVLRQGLLLHDLNRVWQAANTQTSNLAKSNLKV